MNKSLYIVILPILLLGCTLANSAAPQLPRVTDRPVQALQSATPAQLTCTVTAFEALNLRDAPGTSAAVIGTLKHGDLLTILPYPAQGDWIRVTAGGFDGWINQNYCKRNNGNER